MRDPSGRSLRAAALLALAGFGVHQARYALVPDAHGEGGHAYLHAIAPVALAALVALALGRSLAALGARRQAGSRAAASPLARWLAASAALLVLHVGQEGAERLLAGAGPLDAGALLVVPLCLIAGAAVALALRGAEHLIVTAPGSLAIRPRLAPASLPAPAGPAPPLLRILARHLAGRAPPALA